MPRRRTIVLPEGAPLALSLAGPVSRALAVAVDHLIQLLVLINLHGILDPQGALWGLPTAQAAPPLLLLSFSLFWGYDLLFEQLLAGQTPGKRLLGLQVLSRDGLPPTVSQSAIRTLLRPLDLFPLAYGLAGVSVLFSPERQRLGDLAAGTWVVYRRPLPPEDRQVPAHAATAAQLQGMALARWARLSNGAQTRLERLGLGPEHPVGEDDTPSLAPVGSAAPLERHHEALAALRHLESLSHLAPSLADTRSAVLGTYHQAHPRRRAAVLPSLLQLILHGIPRRLRQHLLLFALASAFLLIPFGWSYELSSTHPDAAWQLTSEAQRANILNFERDARGLPMEPMPPWASSYYFTHNTEVAFTLFSGGLPVGLLTAWHLGYNGVVWGTTLGLGEALGARRVIYGFMVAHSPFEWLGLLLAGTSGLLLAQALLRPGGQRRLTSLVEVTPAALELMAGAMLLLALAAWIEGNISPSDLPLSQKETLGAVSTGLLLIWLLLGGRRVEGSPRDQDTPAR